MAVYVDPLVDYTPPKGSKWKYGKSCHLTADSEQELDDFAKLLKLKPEWKQHRDNPLLVHYDLTAKKRAKAIELGAVALSFQELRKRIRERLATIQNDTPVSLTDERLRYNLREMRGVPQPPYDRIDGWFGRRKGGSSYLKMYRGGSNIYQGGKKLDDFLKLHPTVAAYALNSWEPIQYEDPS